MDQDLLVDDRIDDGEKVLSLLVRSGFDVAVAFWLQMSEDSSWYLYIASNAVNPGRVGDAYRTLYACLTKIPNNSVAISEVMMVPASDPIARAALALRDRKPEWLPVRYQGKRLGDQPIEEAYIYPKTGPMTRDDVLQTVIALLKRGGRAQSLNFTFADGSNKQAIPVGVQLPTHGPSRRLQIVLLDASTGQTQAVAADEVTNIQ